ncbi:MAG: cupredoxin domain-containing protein [Ilumatobacteraceae bacterium]
MTSDAPIIATVLLAAAVLAGCADDGNDVTEPVPVGVTEPTEPPTVGGAVGTTSIVVEVTPTTVPDRPVVDVEPTGVVVSVIALDNSFRPEVVEVSVGDEVEWENRGLNEHNVLRVEGDGWGVEVTDFQPGARYSHVFSEPGEYRYYCSIHGNTEVGMVGTVLVRG